MNERPEADPPAEESPARSLAQLLQQNEDAKVLVDECAAELSSVNTALKEKVAGQHPLSVIETALEKGEAIEDKVQEVADKLADVNEALEVEVQAHHLLEQQLTTLAEDERVARHAALHDPLTGLPNRALFEDRLQHGLAQVRRYERTLAVMFIDLNDFKQINDSHGHAAGDAVLKIIAQRLQQITREDDTVSRHGGDEFLYLLMEIAYAHDVVPIAEKIAQAIQAPCQLDIGDLIVQPSIGIAIFPKDGSTAADLIQSADQAMYEAKRNRSGYAFAR